MASFYVDSVTQTTARLVITGAQANVYRRWLVRLATNPNAFYDNTWASSNSGLVSVDATGLTPNTAYVANAKASTNSAGVTGDWLLANGFPFTTLASTTGSRPSEWYWPNTWTVGSALSVPATTWNQFQDRINEFRRWKGITNYNFSRVSAGQPMQAADFNNCLTAISAMVSVFSQVSKGSVITKNDFNNIATRLNAVY